jgi:hypothetical protein
MARGKSAEDLTTLQMALVGYQLEKQKIEGKISEIQSQLRGKRVAAPGSAGGERTGARRELSPDARKRIAAAQKKRWAEHRKRVAAQAKSAGKQA